MPALIPHVAPQKILAIKIRALGDTILLTGTLRTLKRHYPQCVLHVMVSREAAPLLENLAFIDRLISVDEPRNIFLRILFWLKMKVQLKNNAYSHVLVFHASSRSALVGRLLTCTGLCIINDHNLKSSNRWSQVTVPSRGIVKSNIDRDLDVLRAMNITANLEEAMPELTVTPQEKEKARKTLESYFQNTLPTPLIFLGIGASRNTKRWPQKHFVDFMSEALKQNPRTRFIMCVIENDDAWLKGFLETLTEALPQWRQTRYLGIFEALSLRDVISLMAHTTCYVGNDSGMKHVAVGLSVPTLTIFGPEIPIEWHPYDAKKHPYFFIENLSCRTAQGTHWCALQECLIEKNRCMTEIKPQQIIKALPWQT